MSVRNLKGHKILVDANVLIAASILYTGKELGLKDGLKHQFYNQCKTLINVFSKRIDEKIGFYTKLVDDTCDKVLRKAVLNTIEEIKKNNSEVEEEKLLNAFSVIYSESLRRLEENKEYLVKETVNKSKVEKFMAEVLLFFNVTLKREIEKHNPKIKLEKAKNIKATSWKMRIVRSARIEEATRSFPYYGVLKRKFIDSSPDLGDIELLAQSMYFNDFFAKTKTPFYLASTDHHFVGIERNKEINDFVPALIKNILGVECLKPDQILSIKK